MSEPFHQIGARLHQYFLRALNGNHKGVEVHVIVPTHREAALLEASLIRDFNALSVVPKDFDSVKDLRICDIPYKIILKGDD